MSDGIPPLIAVLRANASQFVTTMGEATAATRKVTDETGKTSTVASSHFDKIAGAGKAMALGLVGVGVTVGGAALKMGMDFQESMTTLVTGAGESEKNIGMVGDGILNMAGKVGLSSKDLASGMYLIESAGYHGGQGLDVLKAAAEGAKVGNADMKTVADGLTTALTDYHLPASQAADVTSKLVETVASGKTTMGDLAGSLATVLPIASTAKVGLDQVLGAMATMTAKGTPAADAATYLKQTIANLSNPTSKAAGEMKSLGLDSIDVSQNLGKRGLTGTLQLLTDHIAQHMGPAGTVLIDTLKKSAGSASGFQAAISKLPPQQQTYVAALADMVGGTKSMQAALMLTGDSAGTFQDNVKNIGKASSEAGGHVQGFAETQKDLKTKLTNAKDGVEAMVTKLGMGLIPVVTRVLDVATKWGNWLVGHKAVLIAVAGIIGTVVVVAIGAYIAKMVMATAQSLTSFAKMVASGASWVATTAAQVASSTASFATWAAEGIGKAVTAAATGFVSMITAGAGWVAETAAQVAGAIAAGAGWIAEHIAMAAVAVAQYGIMAAAATAAFIAENAATLGIGVAIAAVVAGVIWLATHWKQAWDAIVTAAKWAYDNVIKPVGEFIVNNAIHPIGQAIGVLGQVWGAIWGGIKGAIDTAWTVIKQIAGWINTNAIQPVKSAIGDLGTAWGKIWDAITKAISAAWGTISGIVGDIVGAVQKAVGWLQNLLGLADSGGVNNAFATAQHGAQIANAARTSQAIGGNSLIQGLANMPMRKFGGWIPGNPDTPVPMIGHGSEYMLSVDMLAGRQPIDPAVRAAIDGAPSMSQQALAGGGGGSSGGSPQVTVIAHTNASPLAIASQVGWTLRAMA